MAVSPFADSVALATTAGIFTVDLMDAACHVVPLAPTLRTPATALTWNSSTSEVGGRAAGCSCCNAWAVLRQVCLWTGNCISKPQPPAAELPLLAPKCAQVIVAGGPGAAGTISVFRQWLSPSS